MVQLVPLIIVLPLLAFYLWMFRDMANNDKRHGYSMLLRKLQILVVHLSHER
jgi:hypothetical protein